MSTSENVLSHRLLPSNSAPTPIRTPLPHNGPPVGISPALFLNMTALSEFLATDVGAAWALAGELSGGVPIMQAIIFTYAGPGMAALAVGAAAFVGTTWLDTHFDGALHEAFGGAVEMVLRMDPGEAETYFGGDGFTTNNTEMMSDICSNWTEIWEDIPVVSFVGIAPHEHPFS